MDEFDPQSSIYWSTTWEMMECCGCEFITLRKTFWFSEADGPDVSYFPPAVTRRPPGWLEKIPDNLRGIMKEIYAALGANSRRLAVAGARIVIDMLIVDKVGDVGSFEQKLNELVQRGFLSPNNREYLQAALEAGHAAVHRGHRATPEEVDHVMDIVENLLQAVYVLPEAKDVLLARTPPRSSP